MSAANLNDTPLHLHEWAELDHIAALECLARQRQAAKLTEADLDAADARRDAAAGDGAAPTVRRYPRSLAEAFPRDHAAAIEVSQRPTKLRLRHLLLLAMAIAFTLATLAYNLTGPQP